MAPPRPIQGTIGSRAKVVLGNNGQSWLLSLDNDTGNQKWQSNEWKSIPPALGKQIKNCAAKRRDLKFVDFGPGNSWYVNGVKADGTGGHSWWGGLAPEQSAIINKEVSRPHPCKVALGSQSFAPSMCIIHGRNGYSCTNTPAGLSDRIQQTHSRNGTIHIIRLFSSGQYYIKDDQGSRWTFSNNSPLGAELKKNKKVEDVAVAGDGSWIVIRADCFVSSKGVDSELKDKLNVFFTHQKERKNKRQREIKEYHDREKAEREAREAAERERQEAAERAAREEEERRAEEERKRREEEERVKKAAEEESRATILEVKLVEKLTQEKESIDKLEKKLDVMQDHLEVMQDHFSTMQEDLYSRKRSMRESIVALPPAQRPRWNLEAQKPSKRQEKPQCVICQDKAPVWAVVPCGHLCLCDDCAPSISQRSTNDRLCPLCRGAASSTLRIYS